MSQPKSAKPCPPRPNTLFVAGTRVVYSTSTGK